MPDPALLDEAVDIVAAVAITEGAVGLHAGVAFRDADKRSRVIHLAMHERLEVDPAVDPESLPWAFVRSTADPLDLATLAGFCDLVALVLPSLPYGFRSGESKMLPNGEFALAPSEIGLTCSTFVMEMFAYAKVDLLDRTGWPTRPEDVEAQRKLVEIMRKRNLAPKAHIDRLAEEVGCLRFRSEEVAAASGLDPRPVAFAAAEPAGVYVLQRFGELSTHTGRPEP